MPRRVQYNLLAHTIALKCVWKECIGLHCRSDAYGHHPALSISLLIPLTILSPAVALLLHCTLFCRNLPQALSCVLPPPPHALPSCRPSPPRVCPPSILPLPWNSVLPPAEPPPPLPPVPVARLPLRPRSPPSLALDGTAAAAVGSPPSPPLPPRWSPRQWRERRRGRSRGGSAGVSHRGGWAAASAAAAAAVAAAAAAALAVASCRPLGGGRRWRHSTGGSRCPPARPHALTVGRVATRRRRRQTGRGGQSHPPPGG